MLSSEIEKLKRVVMRVLASHGPARLYIVVFSSCRASSRKVGKVQKYFL